jgi:hypothetical protein
MITIFQHIAKTGGSSIGKALSAVFRTEQQLSVMPGPRVTALGTWSMEYVAEAWGRLPAEQQEEIRLVAGHLPFGVHEIFQKCSKYVTILRDPVERVLSGFYYSIDEHFRVTKEHVTLEEYVFRKRHYDLGLNNHQTRLVSGIADLDPFGNVTTGNARPITKGDLAIALNNLRDHYLLVGITERSEQFLARLASFVGCLTELRPALPKINVTNGRPPKDDVDPHIINEIRKHNQFDLELYEHAKKTFDALGEL